MKYVFDPAVMPSLAVAGDSARFPVHRIYCIGRNYADHAREMGSPVERGTPMFFCKPADAIVPDGVAIDYPLATGDLHHEVEMVVALHSGGTAIDAAQAPKHIFGYGVGIDLTRRDLQAAAKTQGKPWDVAKAFDNSAPTSSLRRASEIGHPEHAIVSLTVNGQQRQHSNIDQMLFSVPQIIHELSKLFELKAGDLIFTGTPAGVAALQRGDTWHAQLEGVAQLHGTIR